MDVAATTESSLSTGADAVALPLFDGEELATALPDTGLRALVDSGEARPTYKHVAHTHIDGRRAILVGLGARRDLTPERARVAAALGLRRARKLGATAL